MEGGGEEVKGAPATKSYRTRRRTVHEWQMLLSLRIRRSVFSFLGHYRSTETYIVPSRGREVGPGRWRSYCSISPQHLARYPSLIAFPRVLRPLACIAASILCNRTPRDLVCPSSPSTLHHRCHLVRPSRRNDFCISRSIRTPSLDNGSPNSSSEMSN